ncbi:hypothetical protein [Solicola gregarius]|uniref:Uncharacterized protein n=1 Tax=Solicola gregarius TaxID=2908642 RepID=A0AA46YMX7_9ACTN|nr:hypothetical protein [Solicola gregarius]UYM07049.1 hypothetical protein L0C25_08220 [Solicola gregarius]
MFGLPVTRKHAIWFGAGVLVLLLIAVVVLMRLSTPAEGRLKHDDTLQTTRIDKVWRQELPRADRCLVIRLKADITGNARPTWGLTGAVTVWEHLRVHDATLGVEAQVLREDGECGDPIAMDGVAFRLLRKAEDGTLQRMGQLGGRFGKGRYGNSINEGFVGRLAGGTHDRGDSYQATLGVYVDPDWDEHDNVSGDVPAVTDTFELPISDAD